MKIRCEETFGYSVFRFTEGYRQMPSYIPPLAQAAEEQLSPEMDRYKAATEALVLKTNEEIARTSGSSRERVAWPFVRK